MRHQALVSSTFYVTLLSAVIAVEFGLPNAIRRFTQRIGAAHQIPFLTSDDDDETKTSFKFVALGDSFAAGPGAGDKFSWWDFFNTCRRSDHSYPAVIHSDPRFDPDRLHTFEFFACTGATIDTVITAEDGGSKGGQLEHATHEADVTTLSIGGNDVGFFDVLNSCIYHFYGPGSPEDCHAALNNSAVIINSTALDYNLDLVIAGVLRNAQGAADPRLFITGYPHFFNAETTQCNNVTFCIWNGKGKNSTCPSLTQDLRRLMNNLTMTLNVKISAAVARAEAEHTNASITFVNYDDFYDGHRFCEPQNTEPDYNNPEIWFYQTWGDAGEGKRPDDVFEEPSYEDVDPDTCLESARASGDWGRLAVCYMARAKRQDPGLQPDGKDGIETEDLGSWITPNQLARIFHPKIGGHHMVAERILGELKSNGW